MPLIFTTHTDQMNKCLLPLKVTFLFKPWKCSDESRQKAVFFTASHFSSGETHMWSHMVEAFPLTILKINILVVERQKLETLLVGYGDLSSLSSNNPEEGRTSLWEGIL